MKKNNDLDISFDLEDVQTLDDLSYDDVDMDDEDDMDDIRVTIDYEDGSSVECCVLTIYEIEEQDYIALLPLEDDDETVSGDVIVMRYFEPEDGEPDIEEIEDEEELSVAVQVLQQIMEEEDIDVEIEE